MEKANFSHLNKTSKEEFYVFGCPKCCAYIPVKVGSNIKNGIKCRICNKTSLVNKKKFKEGLLWYFNKKINKII